MRLGFPLLGLLSLAGTIGFDPLSAQPQEESSLPLITGAQERYIRHCQGCHGSRGEGVSETVPRLLDFVGNFVHLPEGRAFLVRVPGVAQAPLNDTEIADLLNWVLVNFSREQLPPDFQPLTTQEVTEFRAQKIVSVSKERASVIDKLKRAGVLR